MLRRFYRTIARLSANLALIRNDPDGNIETLLASQELLFSRITYIENRIRTRKAQIAEGRRVLATRQEKDEAHRVKNSIDARFQEIDQYESVIYVLRSFGDALICLYVTGFNLKPMEFRPKEPPGYLSGKAGASAEWKMLRLLCKRGIPAVLTDLTTSVRHGDIIYSMNGIPQLIEVKAGKGGDVGRRARQNLDRNKLNNYFTSDSVKGGSSLMEAGQEMIRIPMHSMPQYHWDKIEKAITAAYESGFGIQTLERGVRALAILDYGQFEEAHRKAIKTMKQPLMCFVNSYKYDVTGRVPFTLSLFHPEDILYFYEDFLQIIVWVDRAILNDRVRSRGYQPCFEPSDGSLLIGQADLPGSDLRQTTITIAQDLFERVPLEFLSLRWLLDEIEFKLNMTKIAGRESNISSN